MRIRPTKRGGRVIEAATPWGTFHVELNADMPAGELLFVQTQDGRTVGEVVATIRTPDMPVPQEPTGCDSCGSD